MFLRQTESVNAADASVTSVARTFLTSRNSNELLRRHTRHLELTRTIWVTDSNAPSVAALRSA